MSSTTKEKQRDTAEQKKAELEKEIDDNRNEITEIVTEKGILETEIRRYETKSEDCRKLVQSIIKEFDFPSLCGDNPQDQTANGILIHLKRRQEEVEQEINKIKASRKNTNKRRF